MFITAPLAVDPIRDAVNLAPVSEAHLEQPDSYLAIAPISNALDTLTLLTVGQHIAILLTAILAFVLFRVLKNRRRPTSIVRETLTALGFFAGLVLTYAIAAIVPRPMARLVVGDPTVLSIDFHAHTEYSHDGRSGWDEHAVRNWARAGGIDAVFITDHRTFEGAERGVASNPGQAGEGTMLLQGLEAFYKGEHVNILGAGRRYRGLTTPDLKDVDADALNMASLIVATAPVMIETVPANLSKMIPFTDSSGGVMAIEIVDGSPRGLSQTRRERARIVHLADSLNLALVTGSDNHGWGRVVPAWTLMRIPGWRGMTSDSLSREIEDILRTGRFEATRPVERTVASATNPLTVALAAPLVTWRMFTTLGPEERVMWLVWAWGLALLLHTRPWRLRS